MTVFRFMGVGDPETFRCRVYSDAPDADDRARARFVRDLAAGWVETEDGDPRHDAIARLLERGYVASEIEPASAHGLGPVGRVKVWRLTDSGRRDLLPLAQG